jgi:hypothetical protein
MNGFSLDQEQNLGPPECVASMLTANLVRHEPPLAMFQRCLASATGIINKKFQHSRKKQIEVRSKE